MNKRDNPLNPDSKDFCMLDYDCAYIQGNSVRMNYKFLHKPTMQFNSAVIKRGWRRFGKYYFHPICKDCHECKSLRIDAQNFKLTKSQKKAKNRNKDTKVVIQKPSVSKFHIDVYNKYHLYKSQKDGWRQKDINTYEYKENFVFGCGNFGKEVLYIIDDKLVGVDLIDILDDGISSIYFFYDPDYNRYSLGTYSLIYQIELAKKLNLRWIYLGYWVDGCKAFSYKTNFKPMQILDDFPSIEQEPDWKNL